MTSSFDRLPYYDRAKSRAQDAKRDQCETYGCVRNLMDVPLLSMANVTLHDGVDLAGMRLAQSDDFEPIEETSDAA